jgi:hypothetical protein
MIGAPFPEVVVRADLEGDFRDEASFACWEFKRIKGRLPNYVGVHLAQVEQLEASYEMEGVGLDACNPPGVPLLFLDATDLPPPQATMVFFNAPKVISVPIRQPD